MRPPPPHGAQSAPWGPRRNGATSAERGPHRASCARWGAIPGVFERGATQPDGMQRRPNAVGVSPRAVQGATADAAVEARSASLPRELGLPDLVLTQILFIVGLPWVGVAAKLGHAHVIFWLIAMALFYLPSAAVVIYLNRLMPLEGGLYQWAKLGFSEAVGFMLAWNLWLYVIVNTSEIGLQSATYLAYALGPSAAW